MAKKVKNLVNNRRKMTSKTKILGTLGLLLAALFICIVSPLFVHAPLSSVSTVAENTVGQSATLKVKQVQYNPKTHLFVEQLVLVPNNANDGNTIDLDSDTTKDVANMRWSVKAVTQKGDNTAIKASVKSTQKQMLTIYAKHVPTDYQAIRFDVKASKKNELLTSQIITKGKSISFRYYELMTKVPTSTSAKVQTKQDLNNDFINWQIKSYQRQLAKLQKENRKSRADMNQNKQLSAKLKKDMEDQTTAQQTDTQAQIDSYDQATEQDQADIDGNKDKVTDLRGRIKLLKQQLSGQ